MSQGSLNPNIRFLGVPCSLLTHRQNDYCGHPFRVSGFFPSTYHQGSAQLINIFHSQSVWSSRLWKPVCVSRNQRIVPVYHKVNFFLFNRWYFSTKFKLNSRVPGYFSADIYLWRGGRYFRFFFFRLQNTGHDI